MCTGAELLLLASAGATVAGTASSVRAGRKQRAASEAAAQFELDRRRELEEQSKDLFKEQLAASDPGKAEKDAEAAAAASLAATHDLINQPDSGFVSANNAPGASKASPVVKEAAARTLADELQRAEGQM